MSRAQTSLVGGCSQDRIPLAVCEDQQGGSNDFHFLLPMLYKCLDFGHKPGCSLMPCSGGIGVLKYKMQNPCHIIPLGGPVSTLCQCSHCTSAVPQLGK